MKNISIPLIIAVLLMLSSCSLFSDDYKRNIEAERQTKDSTFLIKSESPLSDSQIALFTGLNYYRVKKKFVFEAQLEKLTEEQIIKLKTSTDRLPEYKIYAYVYFDYHGKKQKLTAYQSLDHQLDSENGNLLFLPFTDNNSTITTYGGGRYVDFEIPDGDSFILDFNKAYNPYCAYNHKWSCVIPPSENALNIAINAGEKIYHTNH